MEEPYIQGSQTMNPKDFRATSAGKGIRTPTGYAAFIPAKLSPTLLDLLNKNGLVCQMNPSGA